MACLIMTLPLFSQIDIISDSLICIPVKQAKQVAIELTLYDLCQQERDSLKAEVKNLNQVTDQNLILISQYNVITDSLFLVNQNSINSKAVVDLENQELKTKNKSLKKTRNFTMLTTILTVLIPILLK